jgi:hypothetical protein
MPPLQTGFDFKITVRLVYHCKRTGMYRKLMFYLAFEVHACRL